MTTFFGVIVKALSPCIVHLEATLAHSYYHIPDRVSWLGYLMTIPVHSQFISLTPEEAVDKFIQEQEKAINQARDEILRCQGLIVSARQLIHKGN